jgi:transposase
LARELAEAKVKLRDVAARQNRKPPLRKPFGPRGRAWFCTQDFGPIENLVRDELLERMEHYTRQIARFDAQLAQLAPAFPEVEVLTELYWIGLYSALLIVAELGEVERFQTAKQVGACAGLTARVHQSGGHCYHGSITRQGSPWLRWILLQAPLKVVREDRALRNFYTRVRKRSSVKIARVAVARKLAEICWKRLRHWHGEHAVAERQGNTMVSRPATVAAGPQKGARETRGCTVLLIGHG